MKRFEIVLLFAASGALGWAKASVTPRLGPHSVVGMAI